ncbi:MAG: FAD/NAD(P)-binding protein [Candidatus Binatia bacterium]
MNSSRNPYSPIATEVIEVIVETPTIKTLQLKPETPIAFAAGQFVELTVPGVGEAPFTPSSRASVMDELYLTIMKTGKVTEAVHRLNKGDTVGLRGPLGTGYPIDLFQDKEVLVVGGGCGFAPLRSLMYSLFERAEELKKLLFRGGCKSARDLLYRQELEEWAARPDLNMQLTVDVGDESWKGPVGTVTTILDDIDMECRHGVAIVCGPSIMMKFVTAKLVDMGFQDHNIYISMEKHMSCGIGKCGHCRLGTYYVCKDGPVFPYDKIKRFPDMWT